MLKLLIKTLGEKALLELLRWLIEYLLAKNKKETNETILKTYREQLKNNLKEIEVIIEK